MERALLPKFGGEQGIYGLKERKFAMYFVNTLRTTTLKHLADLAEVDKVLEAYNKERDCYSDEYFKARIAPVKSKRSDIVDAGKKAVKDLLAQYREDVIARYTPNGDELTTDAAVLTSGMKLDKTDLERIFDKHTGNCTMQRIICEYATQHGVKDFSRAFFSEQDRITAAEKLALYAEGALDDPWRASFITNDEYYDKIQTDAIRGE